MSPEKQPDEPVLIMERVFDAPRELVWAALTDPKQVAVWYGGHGFENPVCEMDVRTGGRWRHVMRTPDGVEHAAEFVFIEVVKPAKLVWRSVAPEGRERRAGFGPSDRGPHDNVMTVTLEAAGRRTKWRLVTRFGSLADRDAAIRIGFTTVLAEGVDKLEGLMRAQQA